VLVVDDNSPDGTAEEVERCRRELPPEQRGRLNLLCRPGKLGLGTAQVDGFRWALARDYERICTMDADLSHPPGALPEMLEVSRHAHVVIGSRYVPGGGHKGWPWHRLMLSSLSNLVARSALHLAPCDCTGAFRCFRREVLQRIAFENIEATGYSFQEEILWHCTGRGWRIAEVPITFVDREQGQSKIGPSEIWGGVSTVLRLMFTPHSRRTAGDAATDR
jgi:dolichol-phosphate mannosyltransferase